jgi:RNA polymerase sigma-70 factor (ECF subfamily)
MPEEQTSAAVQRCLDALAGETDPEPIIRALLERAVRRLHGLCATFLHRS